MSTSPHPERHELLRTTVVQELVGAAAARPEEFRRIAPGTHTRYGSTRQLNRAIELYDALLPGDVRIENVRQIAATLGVKRKEAAALLATPSGPEVPLDALTTAFVKGTVASVETFAPEPAHAIVIGAPNTPTPGMHKQRRVYGAGPDGHQRLLTAYLSATYGPQDAHGYSVALGAWVRPSSLDDQESAAAVGRQLAIRNPAAYVAELARRYAVAVDAARPGKRPLPIVIINGRRDDDPSDGVALQSTVDNLTDVPRWEEAVERLSGDRMVFVETGEPSRIGGFGLPSSIKYILASDPRIALPGRDVVAGLKGEDREANLLLMNEWDPLPGLFGDGEEESVSVWAFWGYAVDARSGRKSRLFAFLSNATLDAVFMLLPFGGPRGDRDPLPHLPDPQAHLEAKADIARVARLLVGPSRWVGACRRNAMSGGRDFFHVPSKHVNVRELTFGWGSHLRASQIDFPGA